MTTHVRVFNHGPEDIRVATVSSDGSTRHDEIVKPGAFANEQPLQVCGEQTILVTELKAAPETAP